MERTRPTQQLSAQETQQVLKRAAQLESNSTQAIEPSLDFAEVERIGLEAGLSREAIQRAFVELRTGSLRDKRVPTALDRLLGPESVESQRPMELPPELAKKKLHALLKSELLHPEERQGDRTTWSPTPGLWASIQRGLNWQGQGAWGRGTVTSEVTPAPMGTDALSVVKLEGKPGGRAGYLGALAPGLSMLPVAIAAAVAGHAPPQIPLMIGGFSVLATSFGFWMSRLAYQKRLRSVRLAIERVLENLTGDPDEP